MGKVISEIADNVSDGGRYGFVNYCRTVFGGNDNVLRLHLEGRFPDNTMSPSAVASFGSLLYALFLKSAILSQHGVLYSGSKEYMEEQTNICNNLINNDSIGDTRNSNTSKFHMYMEAVRNQAKELVSILQPELRDQGNAFNVLSKLADKPCSLRLCEGNTWSQIEDDLSGRKVCTLPEKNLILECIDTGYIMECQSEDEWISVVAEDYGEDRIAVKTCIEELENLSEIRWNSSVGTFVRC
jgi:hypothetical protein